MTLLSVYNGSNTYLNPNTEIETQAAIIPSGRKRAVILIDVIKFKTDIPTILTATYHTNNVKFLWQSKTRIYKWTGIILGMGSANEMPLQCNVSLTEPIPRMIPQWHYIHPKQGSFCACVQPMRDDVTIQRHLSLAGLMHRMIPAQYQETHQI